MLRGMAAEGKARRAAQLRHAGTGPSLRPRRGVPQGPGRRPCSSGGGSPRRRSSPPAMGAAGQSAPHEPSTPAVTARRRSTGPSSGGATRGLARPVRRARGVPACSTPSCFPACCRLRGFAKFAQSWFPLALVAMAQTIVMLTGGIDLAVGADGQPRLGGRGHRRWPGRSASSAASRPWSLAGARGRRRHGLDRRCGCGFPRSSSRWRSRSSWAAWRCCSCRGPAAPCRPGCPTSWPATPDRRRAAGPRPARCWKLYPGDAARPRPHRGRRQPRRRLPLRRRRRCGAACRPTRISGVLAALAGLFVAAQTGSGDPLIGSR